MDLDGLENGRTQGGLGPQLAFSSFIFYQDYFCSSLFHKSVQV